MDFKAEFEAGRKEAEAARDAKQKRLDECNGLAKAYSDVASAELRSLLSSVVSDESVSVKMEEPKVYEDETELSATVRGKASATRDGVRVEVLPVLNIFVGKGSKPTKFMAETPLQCTIRKGDELPQPFEVPVAFDVIKPHSRIVEQNFSGELAKAARRIGRGE